MPSKSGVQQMAMAIAEHQPSKLNPENRGLLKMSKGQLHDFAATPRKGLPTRIGPSKSGPAKRGRGRGKVRASLQGKGIGG